MSKLYHLEAMTVEEVEREFDRLDQECRLRAVARRQSHRVNRDPAEDQTDWDAGYCQAMRGPDL